MRFFIYMMVLLMSFLISFPAAALQLAGKIEQGSLVKGQVEPGTIVKLNGKVLRQAENGTFYFALDRDAPAAVTLSLVYGARNIETRTLPVAKRDWDIQRIDGLPDEKVTPSAEDLKRISADNALIGQARNRDTARLFYQDKLIWPVTGRVSGVFGSQRILNGEPRSPHKGIDIAAPPGTPVVAAAPGVISLVHEDMFFTGKTVMIDHGFGLSSIYIHMDDIFVRDGQIVKQGEQIGAVGATGRATGPHLHWGLNWYNVAVDPYPLMPPMPEKTATN